MTNFNISDLKIQEPSQMVLGSKVVYIGESPFTPESWSTEVLTINQVSNSNYDASTESGDGAGSLEHYGDFRVAHVSEIQTGLISEEIQNEYYQFSDPREDCEIKDQSEEFQDLDVMDIGDMPKEDDEPENVAPANYVEPKPELSNDWANAGMSNSLTPDLTVVILEGCESDVEEYLGDVDAIYEVQSTVKATDKVMINNILLPASKFRYATLKENNGKRRDSKALESAEETIAGLLKKIKEIQARMNVDPLTKASVPLWVRLGIAQEYEDNLNSVAAQAVSKFQLELECLRKLEESGDTQNTLISYSDILPTKGLVESLLISMGYEFHSGFTAPRHVLLLTEILAKAADVLSSRGDGAVADLKLFSDIENAMYSMGGISQAELFDKSEAFRLTFSNITPNLNPSDYQVTAENINNLLKIIKNVLSTCLLAPVGLTDDEWELVYKDESINVASYQNKRYSRAFLDVDLNTGTETVTELGVVSFVADAYFEDHFTSENSSIVHKELPFLADQSSAIVHVGADGVLHVPKFNVADLVEGETTIVKHDGSVYRVCRFNRESGTVDLEPQGMTKEVTVTVEELSEVRTITLESFASYNRAVKAGGAIPKNVISSDVKYPAYYAMPKR